MSPLARSALIWPLPVYFMPSGTMHEYTQIDRGIAKAPDFGKEKILLSFDFLWFSRGFCARLPPHGGF